MLRNLHVRNLALIEEAEVDFSSGLNILTGETGAGKSIIIGSINLALGEKIVKEMVRENEKPALVELIFEVEDEQVRQQLLAMEIVTEENEVIMSRKISGGRSVARINGESVPISKMKEVASLLIDIHGQHEHQSLLRKKKHLEILDDYAKEALNEHKEKLKENYSIYQKLKKELEEFSLDEEARMRELSLLEYEVHEIEEASLKPGEDERLETDYRRMSHGRKIMEALSISQDLTASMSEGASERIGRALRELGSVSDYDERVLTLVGELTEIDNLLNDFNRELADYITDAEFDEETFLETERRLDEVNHLKAKYGNTIEKVLEECTAKQKRIEKLQDYDTYRKEVNDRMEKIQKTMEKLCDKVSNIRKKYAKKLTEQVEAALVDLNFLDVHFTMEFETLTDYTANGRDDAEFLISTNPGEPPKPLGKVASGGELSRIMLALKTVLAENDKIGTLIFDEIDTGISGRTAQAVSEKMNVIGKGHQVICITHLPQIAAMADSHYQIAKEVVGKNTVSSIRRLTEEESITELARMLGGVKITDTVLESAKEMKSLAQNTKNS
jgi:DNA repair protein RecN (Recombination protein N)